MDKKLIHRGYCTTLISLPRDWVINNNLDSKSFIDMQVSNSEIILKLKKNYSLKIDFNEIPVWSNHFLCQLYSQGYDKIVFYNIKDKTNILNNLWNFPGIKVFKATETELELSIEEHKSSYIVFLDKMLRYTLENIKLFILGFQLKDFNMKLLNNNIKEIYKLDELITRKINKEVPETDLYYLHEIPITLFFVNKFLKESLDYVLEKKVIISDKIITILKDNQSYLQLYYNYKFFNKPLNLEKHLELRKKLFYESRNNYDYFKGFNNEEFYVLEKVLYISRIISLMMSRIVIFSEIKKIIK